MGFFDSLKRLLSSETAEEGAAYQSPLPDHQSTLTEMIDGEPQTTTLEIRRVGERWLFALNDVLYHQLTDLPDAIRHRVGAIVETL